MIQPEFALQISAADAARDCNFSTIGCDYDIADCVLSMPGLMQAHEWGAGWGLTARNASAIVCKKRKPK
jgi:hypothetical protein